MKLVTFIFTCFTFTLMLQAQVGINTTNPQAALDITAGATPSEQDGLLIPRVDEFPTGVTTAQDGMLVFITGNGAPAKGFYYYNHTITNWTPVTGTSGGTLDQAYDFGGAGAGNIIMATDGAVTIAGEDGILVTGTFGSGELITASGAGTRLFFNPTSSAFRAGNVDGTQWDLANVGTYSSAFGRNTTASGGTSTAFGNNTVASGPAATAFGNGSTAIGPFTTTFGFNTTATSQSAIAFGENTTASGTTSTAFGENTTASGATSTAFGNNTAASATYSTAFGVGTNASGFNATAFGINTIASGSGSTAFGGSTNASGIAAIALGSFTTASGQQSIAMGLNSTASGIQSVAIGVNNLAPSLRETTLGSFASNYTPTSVNTFNNNDRLFSIGNGQDAATRSNALTIYKSGLMNINDAYNMPLTDGTTGQVMTSDGAGNVTFVTPTAVTDTDNQQIDVLNLNGTDLEISLQDDGVTTQTLDLSSLQDGSGSTLDQAYDFGGAGNGNTITATDGAVIIDGEDGFEVTGNIGSGDAINASGAGSRMLFNPNKGAFRAGNVDGAQWDDTNVGANTIAFGVNTIASGNGATAFGTNTNATGLGATVFGTGNTASGPATTVFGGNNTASGASATAFGVGAVASGNFSIAFGSSAEATNQGSIAFGLNTTASGARSTAFGDGSIASGANATAFGTSNTAPSSSETTIGVNATEYTPISSTSFEANDRLFTIGNGNLSSNRSNALTILKSGLMNINDSYNMPLADGTAGQVMSTDGAGNVTFQDAGASGGTLDEAYDFGGAGAGNTITATDGAVTIDGEDGVLVTGTFGSGETITASGAGARMFFNPRKAAFRAGNVITTQWNDINVGDYSAAFGRSTIASGENSTAFGRSTNATGESSTAFGRNSTASGQNSNAFGGSTDATGENATTFGSNTTASSNNSTAFGSSTVASGVNSVAFGFASQALGEQTVTFGRNTIASGESAMAFGSFTEATGVHSVAFGSGSDATGDRSTAFGLSNIAPSFGETSLGVFTTTYTPIDNANFNVNDRLFSLGNGLNQSNRSNALTIYKSGLMNINDEYNMPLTDGTANQVMTTDGAGNITFQNLPAVTDTNTQNTLNEAYNEGGAGAGNTITATDGAVTIDGEDGVLVTGTFGSGETITASGAGTRMFFNPRKAAFRAGRTFGTEWDNANVGNYSVAFSRAARASGDYSFAMGFDSGASGNSSFAFGDSSVASGDFSVSLGAVNTASGNSSIAIGFDNEASGNNTTVFGLENFSQSYGETTMGVFSSVSTPLSATSFNINDRLVSIGNGTNTSNRSNALTIYKSGLMNINDAYNMPLTDGTANQVMTTDGSGNVTFQDPPIFTDTDNQQIDVLNLNGTNLEISLQDDGAATQILDLSSIDTDTDTNTQNTLDQAYDEGGAGVGRIINVDNGAVVIQGNAGSAAATTSAQLILTETQANDFSRIRLTNSIETDNIWTIATRTDDDATLSRMNFNHNGAGDLFQLWGDGFVEVNGKMEIDGQLGVNINDPLFAVELPNSVLPGSGQGRANAWTVYSDNRVKSNQETLQNGLATLLQITPKKYFHHNSTFETSSLKLSQDGESTVGFIAQELYEVLPEAVQKPTDETKDLWSVDYDKVIPVAVKAIQELNEEKEALKDKVLQLETKLSQYEALEARLSALEGASKNFGNSNAIKISEEKK